MIEAVATLKGTGPVLMHNVRLANPLDEFAKRLKEVNGKRGKTDENYAEIAEIEFLGGLYWHKDTGPYIPGEWIFASLVEGARLKKKGKHVQRGVMLGAGGDRNKLVYKGPRDPDKLEKDANFRLVKPVRVGASRVMRTRPIFHEWSATVPIYVDSEIINFEDLREIAKEAGRYVGIGDHRPMYGRYEATLEKV